MSRNSFSANLDAPQLARNIREQIDRRPITDGVQVDGWEPPIPVDLTGRLRSMNDELAAFASQIERGEPSPESVTLRDRMGRVVKRRLNRFLWWQNHQMRALAALTLRRNREEIDTIDVLSQNTARLNQILQQTQRMVLECNQQIQDSESRLQQFKSAQLKFQAAEIERNVRDRTAGLETQDASLQREMSEVKNALNLANRTVEQLLGENAAYKQEIARLAQRVETETVQKEQLAARLSVLEHFTHETATALGQKMDGEIARMEGEIARNERDTAQKEQLAARLSELGLFTHQTRAALSIQDRRLTLFIEEARKRLPKRLADDQLQNMVNQHSQHRYDALYAAFEDALRGSREEIKRRQSVYLPFLKEHGIGSSEMPIFDLGCGRGEWLELLAEQGLKGRGVDSNEEMIERCKSAGLEAIQGDALSYLSALPDASTGAVTAFHMVEHMPFDVTLALVDEILRVLKSGGVIILETPNPQNVLVGSNSFYLDPTHLKPLPSPMLQFFVEARGFCNVQVWNLQPFPESIRFPDDGKGMANRLNDYFYGPQDYAVLARKP